MPEFEPIQERKLYPGEPMGEVMISTSGDYDEYLYLANVGEEHVALSPSEALMLLPSVVRWLRYERPDEVLNMLKHAERVFHGQDS